MLTRSEIDLYSFDFTVEHKPDKFRVVPDTLSRLFLDVLDKSVPVVLFSPRLAAICRNIPDDEQPYQPPSSMRTKYVQTI